MLQLGSAPRLRLLHVSEGGAAEPGALLDWGKTLGTYYDRHGDFEGGLLHLTLEMR